MKTRTLTFLVLAAVLTLPMSAMATDHISFRFTGHVVSIVDNHCSVPLLEPGVISVDDPVSGVFTYDLDATDTNPDPDGGWYEDSSPPSPYYVTMNGLTFQNDRDNPQTELVVANDLSYPDVTIDFFNLLTYFNSFPQSALGLDDPEINIERSGALLWFSDETHTVLSDDALPSSLNLDDWNVLGDYSLFNIHIKGSVSGDPDCSTGFWIWIYYALDTLDLCLDNETGLCGNGIDDDCDGLTDNDDPDCATTPCSGSTASTVGVSPVYSASDLGRQLAYFLLPLGAVIGLMIWRRKR